MNARSNLQSETITSDDLVEFAGIHGARIWRSTAVFVPFVAGWPSGYDREPGTYFGLRVHATRNGKTFGAVQRTRFFVTEIEREAAAAAYLKRRRSK